MQAPKRQIPFLLLMLWLVAAPVWALDSDGDGLPDSHDPCPSLAYLDCNFGTNGRTVTPNTDVANDLVLLPDGKLVAGGWRWSNYQDYFTLSVYNSNGLSDTTFNSTGVVNNAHTGDGNSVIRQADGKLLMVGTLYQSGTTTSYDIGLVRYNTDGTPDTTFNGTGKVSTVVSAQADAANAVIQQADGKIVVAGSTQQRFLLLRYNSNGSLDTSFGTSGVVTTKIVDEPGWNGNDSAYGMVQQSDGKLVVVGKTNSNIYAGPSFIGIAVVRYNSDGTLDTTFNGNGKVVTPISGNDYDIARNVIQQRDGKLVVVGSTFTGNFPEGTLHDAVLLRYTADGALDTTFNGTGKILAAWGGYDDKGFDVVQQADGKLVVSGSRQMGPGSELSDFTVARYNIDGSIDTSFGTTGIIGLNFPPAHDLIRKVASANAIIQQPDGKLVSAGSQCVSAGTYTLCGGTDMVIARYLVDPDSDGDGIYDNGDNCPALASANLSDNDGDNIGDVCDAWPGDTDNDGVINASDNCPLNANADQADSDNDGTGDACETDLDNDGVVNSSDKFPLDPSVSHDYDGDGTPDKWNAACDATCQANSGKSLDNCPLDWNSYQRNFDGDSKGDVCDTDDDGDGVLDSNDTFPLDPTRTTGDNATLKTLYGTSFEAGLGLAASVAGDVNKDGYVDVVVGSRGDNYKGRAIVYSGKDYSALYVFNGTAEYDYLGYAVSGAGDVNNDGYADVLIGAYGAGVGGMAYVYSGVNGSLLYAFDTTAAIEGFGSAVSAAGDVNNDGHDDVIVGNWLDDVGGTNTGSATVYSGADGGVLYKFNGSAANVNLGYSVAGAGDVNNDGYADFMAGAHSLDVAFVYSGIDGSVLYQFGGTVNRRRYVSDAGDVNADGYADFMTGTPSGVNDEKQKVGMVQVYSGADGSELYTFFGDGVGNELGSGMDAAGDINKDGHDDMILAAYSAVGNTGVVQVVSGADGSTLYRFNGNAAGDSLGWSVGGGGDINADGYPDIIAGSMLNDYGGPNAGMLRIYSGAALWTDTDGDGQNDAVDTDADADGVPDVSDAFPQDTDNDGLNNAVDSDDDNDSVLDISDAFPLDASESVDTDNDGAGNNADTDDDNDGVLDVNDKFPLDATKSKFVRHDTERDGDSDVLVRSASTGAWTSYGIQNNTVIDAAVMNAPTASNISYVAQLDANGDGDADILTRNTATGAWYLHQVQNGAVTSTAPIYLYASLDQKFIGTGDFNNDGVDDVMLRSTSAGYYTVFLLGNHAVNSTVFYNAWTAASSVPQAIGDFDGDGTDDLLVRRTSDNLYFIFKTTNGGTTSNYCACNIWANTDWTFQFAGDTNKDGIDDIVIRGTGPTADGKWWAFRINNFKSVLTTNLNLFINKTAITVGAVGDYNGDGTMDVLTRVNNSTTYVSPIVNGAVTGNYWLYNFTSDQVIGK